MAKLHKALDFNKLKKSHEQGKLLKKQLKYPTYVGLKYDGHYAVVIKDFHAVFFETSGGLGYTHADSHPFIRIPQMVYLVERCSGEGKLGQRGGCALKGPKSAQISEGHWYKVFDALSFDEYIAGKSTRTYEVRRQWLKENLPPDLITYDVLVHSEEELDQALEDAYNAGYEGVVGKDPSYIWRDSTSRIPAFFKYKKRPTADLLCIGTEEAGKSTKYAGLIGSLILQDSQGRIVSVGSGMSDEDRARDPRYFIDQVVEVFYEHINETYVQPTFGDDYEGVLVRWDKTSKDID